MRTLQNQNNALPFLMAVTPTTRMEEAQGNTTFVYDYDSQMTYCMGGQTIGTKSFATEGTIKNGGWYSDSKNKIDDTKRK